MQVDITPQANGLMRVSAAARAAGLTPRAMRAALSARQIPVNVLEVGKLQFVRAAELNQWLTSAPAPAAADLFAA
jgi:hypothetical protein